MKNILALDPASITGWAMRKDGVVTSGVLRLSKEGFGLTGYQFSNWLSDKILGIDELWVEKPFTRIKSVHSARCDGIVFVSHLIAYTHDIKHREVHASSWRKKVLGNGRMASAVAKKAAMAWAAKEGFKPETDDEAEALCIMTYAIMENDND